MRVLLINPPIKNIIRTEIPMFVKNNEGVFPPLGLMYLAANIKKNLQCEVQILDALAENSNLYSIKEYIKKFKPQLVGITAYTHNLIDIINAVNLIKHINPKISVCLGGPHVNNFPYESINIDGVDYCIAGEGEESFLDLIKHIMGGGGGVDDIKGLIHKKKDVNRYNFSVIEDIEQLLYPDRQTLNHKRYSSILGQNTYMTTMISSRGCIYRCSFCSNPGFCFRARSASNVVDEIESCLIGGIKEIHFVDDNFNQDRKRIEEICARIKRKNLNPTWSFRGRADNITEDLLRQMKEAGCYRIHFGVETSSDNGLKRLQKEITVEQIKKTFSACRSIGINTVAYFLIGCPYEKDKKDIMRTINFSKELDPDFALFNILALYPQTEIYKEAVRKKIINSDCWEKFILNPTRNFSVPFWEEFFLKEDLFKLLRIAYRKFYCRPKFIFRFFSDISHGRCFLKKAAIAFKILKNRME